MAQETYDWSSDYSDEQAGTTTTFTSTTTETVDVTVSQPDPNGFYRTNRDGFETNSTLGGDNTGYFEMGTNFSNGAQTVTTTIDFANNTQSGADSVTDVSFTLYDIDSPTDSRFVDEVTILAFDEAGNPLTVTLTAVDPTVVSISGATATAIPGTGTGPLGSVAANSAEGNVNVFIAGEVASIQIIYGNGTGVQSNPANQVVGFGDLSFDLTPPVPCFVRGTRIRAMHGEVPIEHLQVGDMVITADNGPQQIRWIGRRSVAGRGKLAPVRFAKGAIGNSRALTLSPQHRVLVSGWQAELLVGHDEVLAAAAHLVNGRDVTRQKRDEVEYFHLMFDRHEIVYAEGAPCESLFLARQSVRAMTHDAREEIETLFPGLLQHPETHGPTARPVLRQFEARLLV